MAEQLPMALRVACDPAEVERVCVRFLSDYLASSGRKGFVIGVSGGIDSAVSAALAVRAAGAARVHALVLPTEHTRAEDLQDARTVAAWLGIAHETVSIQPLVEALRRLRPEADARAQGNVASRLRMVMLNAEAARREALVLGTGNKSEALTGYMTKWGDTGVDVNPLGDLYKTQVRQLAVHLGVPEPVQRKAPTAGLWPGQTDEGELGITYEQLDRVLLGLELALDPQVVARIVGVPVAEVQRIDRLRATTAHKRRMPPSPKLGLRTLGLDWRQPLQEG